MEFGKHLESACKAYWRTKSIRETRLVDVPCGSCGGLTPVQARHAEGRTHFCSWQCAQAHREEMEAESNR